MSDLELNVDRPILSEGADYKLVPLDEDVWGCYVNKYDTTVVFGKIGFDEDEAEDEATLSFDFQIHDGPEEVSEEDEEFKLHIGDTLVSILTGAFETGDYKIGDDGESGTENTQEPTD
jgi:hypothetical protein